MKRRSAECMKLSCDCLLDKLEGMTIIRLFTTKRTLVRMRSRRGPFLFWTHQRLLVIKIHDAGARSLKQHRTSRGGRWLKNGVELLALEQHFNERRVITVARNNNRLAKRPLVGILHRTHNQVGVAVSFCPPIITVDHFLVYEQETALTQVRIEILVFWYNSYEKIRLPDAESMAKPRAKSGVIELPSQRLDSFVEICSIYVGDNVWIVFHIQPVRDRKRLRRFFTKRLPIPVFKYFSRA